MGSAVLDGTVAWLAAAAVAAAAEEEIRHPLRYELDSVAVGVAVAVAAAGEEEGGLLLSDAWEQPELLRKSSVVAPQTVVAHLQYVPYPSQAVHCPEEGMIPVQ